MTKFANVKKKNKIKVKLVMISVPLILIENLQKAAALSGQTFSAFAVSAMEARAEKVLKGGL